MVIRITATMGIMPNNTNTYLSGKIIQDKKDVVLLAENPLEQKYMNGIITPVAVVKTIEKHLPTTKRERERCMIC